MCYSMVDSSKIAKMTQYQLNKIRKSELVKKGDSGDFGKVYKLNDTECIKVLNTCGDNFELSRYNSYANLEFECAVMPKLLYLVNGKFKAYKMNLINGDELCEVSDDFDYSKFVQLADKLIKSVNEEISEEGIIVYDSHDGNIMYDYDKDKFLLIDQGQWSTSGINTEIAKVKNFSIINESVFYTLFPKIFLHRPMIQYGTDFIDYYETKKENFEKQTGIKIKTIGECKKNIGDLC